METIQIDGSYGEGGGSIVRVASALSCITSKPIRVYNIRKGRPQPGLKTQHLQGIKALAELCDAKLTGAEKGSQDIEFYPGKIDKGRVDVEIATAGSTGLVFQTLCIPASRSDKQTKIYINGGATFGKYAPPLIYTQKVLLPILKQIGFKSEINITKHGFFPVGGSQVNIITQPAKEFNPINLTDQGEIEIIEGVSIASSDLRKPKVAERQAQEAQELLRNYKTEIKTAYSDAKCSGSGLVLLAKTSTGCILGADALGERGKKAENVAEEAAISLRHVIKSGAAVDQYLGDQLLIFMALAKGKSEIIVPVLTGHIRTNIWVIQKFLDVEFEMAKKPPYKITCSGSKE
ncbi:MAG: RNA 3'-terminal phosphate cyclase [Candidatus Aenigmatarchaeota archaeon]|nr:RNA 3'-phosphate cyclase [Nanoarchaeota archaeon]